MREGILKNNRIIYISGMVIIVCYYIDSTSSFLDFFTWEIGRLIAGRCCQTMWFDASYFSTGIVNVVVGVDKVLVNRMNWFDWFNSLSACCLGIIPKSKRQWGKTI